MFMQRRGCNIARSYFHEIAETCKLIAAIAGNALAIIPEKSMKTKNIQEMTMVIWQGKVYNRESMRDCKWKVYKIEKV